MNGKYSSLRNVLMWTSDGSIYKTLNLLKMVIMTRKIKANAIALFAYKMPMKMPPELINRHQ